MTQAVFSKWAVNAQLHGWYTIGMFAILALPLVVPASQPRRMSALSILREGMLSNPNWCQIGTSRAA